MKRSSKEFYPLWSANCHSCPWSVAKKNFWLKLYKHVTDEPLHVAVRSVSNQSSSFHNALQFTSALPIRSHNLPASS